MSRKYVGQVNNQNFVYPNYEMTEYDVEIVHDINNNCITGTVTNFSATTISSTGITFTYDGTYNFNGSEPFKGALLTPLIEVPYLSVHCQVPNQTYMNTWRLVDIRSTSYTPPTLPTTGSWSTDSFILAPSYFGLTSFSSGTYFFEFRFIAEKCLYKICTSVTVNMPTPTPTPTPSPTPGGPTPTPAPVGQCYCYEVQVTGTTGGEGGIIATLDYNDCYAVRTGRAFTIGPGTYKVCIQTVGGVVQWFPEGTYGIDTSNLLIPGVGNCNTGYSCSGYVPAGTPTPTPTATPTPTPGGPTPTPTPTATSTPTPTPTSTGSPITPTPTPTATAVPPTYTYLVNCSGSLQGYCLGNLSAGTQVLIGGICYVATTTTTSPTGTLISGAQTLGTCCPTPTPTPTPAPVGIGIYTGATFGNATLACNNSNYPSGTVYIANGDTLSNGDVLYTNTGLSTPFNGNDNYYRLLASGSSYYAATISGSGTVSNLTACSGIATPTPTPTATSTPTPTPTAGALTSIGTTDKVSATSCGVTGTTPEIFLDSTDYSIFLSNFNCLSDGGSNTVSVIRDSFGDPIFGTFYFVWYGGGCSTTTFKSTNGNITINPTQC